MSKTAVIFDTNSCHVDRTAQSFFGQHTILEEIATRATIIMPQIVIDELIQQNVEGTNESITALRTNPLLPALGFDLKKLDEIVSHEHARSLMVAEQVTHEIIDIEDTNRAFEKIRDWVIPGNPPFNKRTTDGKNNSDKGLKDALVACTIDELLEKAEYDAYYLATSDGRLKDYYADNRRIQCLLPRGILDKLKQEFFDEYTIDIIRNEIGKKLAMLKKNWLNINSDAVALFECKEDVSIVILDASSKEVIKSGDLSLVSDTARLVSSGGYATTHEAVGEIMNSLEFYTQDDLIKVKDALMTNDQIYGIGTDEDVKSLASLIYTFFEPLLTDDEKHRFDVYYNLKEL